MKVKFWYEKLVTRLLFPLVFVGFLGVFVNAYYLELQVPDANEKLAPFRDTVSDKAANDLIPFDQITSSIETPHRTANQIQGWVTMVVSEALTFEGNDYEEVTASVRPYFTDEAYTEYLTYLTSMQIKENLEQAQYRAGIFFDQNPFIGKGAALEGRYRWKAEMPISLSFSSKTQDNVVNRKVSVLVQIRRETLPDDPNAILIESWKVNSRRD